MTKSSDEEKLSAYMLFRSLGPKEAGELNEVLEKVEFAAGDQLFAEGDPGDSLFIIRDGAVEIRKKSPSGEEQVLASLGKFAMFGEMSLITEAPRNATAVASAATKAFRIDKQTFLDLLDAGSLPAYKICLAIARFLAHRLDQLDEKLVSLARKSESEEARQQIREFTAFKMKLLGEWKED